MKKLILLLVLLFFSSISFAQVAVIVNKSVSEKELSSSKILEIYQLKTQRWQSGDKIEVLGYAEETAVSEKFYGSLGTKLMKMKKVWLKAKLSGNGIPPSNVSNEDGMVSKVAEKKGAIGFVTLSKVNDSVKVIAILN